MHNISKISDQTNNVHIFDNNGALKQTITTNGYGSFGVTLVLSKNKRQLLISDHLKNITEEKEDCGGVIHIYNSDSTGKYEPYQMLTNDIPYDNFGQTVYTNYDYDKSFNKLNRIISRGGLSGFTEFRLIKDKWVKVFTDYSLYIVSALNKTIISKLTIAAKTANSKVRVIVVPSGDVLESKHAVVHDELVELGRSRSYLEGVTIAAGDQVVIRANTGSSNVSFSLFDVEISP